ncbi:RDD family protein [Kribbella sp. NPDC051952]|uniref:RDD family protein n=1 Tax=Kribbella sp. NPDC051952 TaxID=3154851 RepID=UPI00341CF696
MSFPAGWYDDPQDRTQQRYWDGSTWTDQRRPQQGPPPHQGQFGQTAQHGQVYGGGRAGPTQYGQYTGQPQQQAPYQQQPSQQGYPPHGQQGYPPQGYGYPGQKVHTTPDGQPLSGWWRRVWARVLDSIIVGIIGLPLTGYFYYQYFQVIWDYMRDTMDRASAGEQPPSTFELPSEAYKWMIPAILLGMLVSFVYEYLFLTKKGATLGKMALGIKVRLRDVPGNPPGSAVAKRYGFEIALGLLGSIPLVGTLFGFLALINYLWPLWDDKKQALHDKVAGTNVVRVS